MATANAENNQRIEELEKELSEAKKEFAEVVKNLNSLLSDKGEELKGDAKRMYKKARKRAGEFVDNLEDEGEQAWDQARDYMQGGCKHMNSAVRENPMAAIGIAAGLGFLFGFLTRR